MDQQNEFDAEFARTQELVDAGRFPEAINRGERLLGDAYRSGFLATSPEREHQLRALLATCYRNAPEYEATPR